MDTEITLNTTEIDLSKVTEYISFDSKQLLDLLKQLETIINLKASKLSRGITLRVYDENTVMLICPNELYFFTAEIPCTTTLEPDTSIYLDYVFLQKLSKFFINSFYVFKYDDKFYLKLSTGNLEIINPYLLDVEKKKLDNKNKLKDTKHTYKMGNFYNKLKSLCAITNFEREATLRWINSYDGKITFKSQLLYAKTEFEFINAQIDYKILSYLLYLCEVGNSSDEIEIYDVASSLIPKFAIKYKGTEMISNYPNGKPMTKLLSVFEDLPKFTIIDYADLKYKLEYANSITYARGVVTFINRDGKLIGKIKLTNNSETEVEIPVLGELYLKPSQQIRINFDTLLLALSTLDSDLQTYFGLKDGFLYLINSDISLALFTF